MPLARVQNFLKQFDDLQVTLFDTSTHTAELAAQALNVEVGQIAKTLVFLADKKPVLVVTAGDKRVNTKLLAKTLGVKKVSFANSEKVQEFTGFPPGGVSPIGLLTELPIYLDKSLYLYDVVYAAAGTANSALPITPDRLAQITCGQLIDVCQ